jgi:hypothetical protein
VGATAGSRMSATTTERPKVGRINRRRTPVTLTTICIAHFALDLENEEFPPVPESQEYISSC